LFEKDVEQTQEGKRHGKLSATPSNCAASPNSIPKLPSLDLLLRFCGVLARSSKSAGSSVFCV
jgi:hypothetical protein